MIVTEWIRCPVCGSKTRDRIREDTILKKYPLYCPKCRQETLIKVKNGNHESVIKILFNTKQWEPLKIKDSH